MIKEHSLAYWNLFVLDTLSEFISDGGATHFVFLFFFNQLKNSLTLSWRSPLSYRNQSIDLYCKSMDWFLYDNGLRHERVKLLLTLRLFFKSFHLRHVITHNSTKFIIFLKFILQILSLNIFLKNYWIFAMQIVPNFTQFHNALEISSSICPKSNNVWNFAFGKFLNF